LTAESVDQQCPRRHGSALGFGKVQTVTGYGGLSGLGDGNAVRRAVVMVDVARVAA